jgi:hypothetical protein
MERAMRAAAIALVALAAACHRSSGDDARTVYPQEGIWQGSMVAPISGAVTSTTLIVEPGGRAYLVPVDGNGEPLSDVELWGRLLVEGGIVSGWLGHSDSWGSASLDVTGSIVARASMQHELHDAANPGSFYDGFAIGVGFDATWDRHSTPGRVAGNWTDGSMTLAVAADGSFEGGDAAGDRFYGSLRPGVADVDLYWFEIEAYYTGEYYSWYFQGVAVQIDRGSPDGTLLFTTHGSQYGWLGPSAYWTGLLTR